MPNGTFCVLFKKRLVKCTIIEIRSKSLFVTYAVVQAQEYDKDDFGPEYHNPYVYSEFELGDYPDVE